MVFRDASAKIKVRFAYFKANYIREIFRQSKSNKTIVASNIDHSNLFFLFYEPKVPFNVGAVVYQVLEAGTMSDELIQPVDWLVSPLHSLDFRGQGFDPLQERGPFQVIGG